MSLLSELSGTGVALITPFKSNLEVDYPALGRVIDLVIEGGVDYVVTLGTTGESPTLTKDEKKAIIKYTYDHVNGRVPVVVGIGGNNTADLIKDLETFPLDKAIAVLSASPYYSKPSQEGLYAHYQALAKASPRPILLYNVPGRTGRNVNALTIIRLANEVPNIVGIKEAGGDMTQCMSILKDRPDDFLIVSGDDALTLPQIACGMDGVISVIANCMPARFTDMVMLSLQEKFKEAKALNDSMIEAYELLFAENNPAGVKAFLAQMGYIDNVLRLPLVPLSDGIAVKMKNYINREMKPSLQAR